jgi:hypothetical protein
VPPRRRSWRYQLVKALAVSLADNVVGAARRSAPLVLDLEDRLPPYLGSLRGCEDSSRW